MNRGGAIVYTLVALAHQPRSIHSCRLGRSAPIEVSRPWPG
jgi:hypothetical protein